jgi:hypothetical protein
MSQDYFMVPPMPPLAPDWSHATPNLGDGYQNGTAVHTTESSDSAKTRRMSQPFSLALGGSVWGQSDGDKQSTWTARATTASNIGGSVEELWGGGGQTSPSSGPLSLSPSTSSDGGPSLVPSIGMDLADLVASSMTLEPTAKPFTPGMVASDSAVAALSMKVNAPAFVPKTTQVSAPEFVPKMGEASMANIPEFVPKMGVNLSAPEFIPKTAANLKGTSASVNNALPKTVLTSNVKAFVPSGTFSRGAASIDWEVQFDFRRDFVLVLVLF